MTPDQLQLIEDAVFTLTNYDATFDLEDLTLLIQHARETLEEVLHIQEDEVPHVRRYKCHD